MTQADGLIPVDREAELAEVRAQRDAALNASARHYGAGVTLRREVETLSAEVARLQSLIEQVDARRAAAGGPVEPPAEPAPPQEGDVTAPGR